MEQISSRHTCARWISAAGTTGGNDKAMTRPIKKASDTAGSILSIRVSYIERYCVLLIPY